MFLLAATAGVTVQPPRMLCRIAAAAPGWPSIVAYWADWVNRPNAISAPISPLRMPSGNRKKNRPVTSPTITNTARMPTPMSATMGSAQGLALRTMPAAMRICLMRPRLAGSELGNQPDDHEHGQDAHADERDDGQRPGIGLADHARRHADLLDAAETRRIRAR